MTDSEHDDVLARLLAGDLDEESDAARAAFAGDPTLRQRLAALRAIEADVDLAAAEDRSDLAAARVMASAPGERHVEPGVRAFARQRASRRDRHTTLLLASVAAAILTVLALWSNRGDADDRGGKLPPSLGGAPAAGALLPDGEVDRYGPLRWNLELPPGGRFLVIVFDGNDRELARSDELVDGQWDPAARAASWPGTVRWEVHVRSADGNVVVHEANMRRREPR